MASRFVISAFVVLLASTLVVSALPVPNPTPNDPLPGASSTDPALVGRWSAPFEGGIPAISMVLAPNGDILYWGGVEARERDNVFFTSYPYNADVAVLSPPYDAASVTRIVPPEELGDMFCAGQTILGDGTVLIAGGSKWQDIIDPTYAGFVSGLHDTWAYDAEDRTFTKMGDMKWPRWYPTIMTGADGNAIAIGGIDHLVEPQTMVEEMEVFDGAEWANIPGGDLLLPMYPRIFTVPNGPLKGDLFYETSATLWGPFGEHPLEATWNIERAFDFASGDWSIVGPSLFGYRQHAATVMLPLSADDGYTARVMTFGGSLGRSVAATPLTEITTLANDGTTIHTMADTLAHPRWMANGVLLPDGTVLAVGGGLYDNVYAHGQPVPAVLTAEKYDPAEDAWTQMAAMTVPRIYHSSALLLPDGRVLAGGHVPLPVPWAAFRDNFDAEAQVVETRFEIYEPPYLHWGVAQPTITSAPESVAFGETFTITTPDAASVVDAMLVRNGATTHVWDSNERAIVLDVEARGDGTLTFVAPPDGDVATPGPWMLFLRVQADEGLVPGIAKTVMVG